jgi:hypothetical protein
MFIWRRLHDPSSGFPQPIYIARRKAWWRSQVVAWIQVQAAARPHWEELAKPLERGRLIGRAAARARRKSRTTLAK